MGAVLSKQSVYALTGRCGRGLMRPLFVFLLVMIAACNKTEPASVNDALRKLNAKDYRGCLAELDRVVAANPSDAFAYGTRAFCHDAVGDIDGAIADYSSAIAIHPQNPASFNNRGSERMRKNDFEGALADFETAVRLNPRYAQAQRNLGTVKKSRHDFNGALAEYDRAIEIEPNNAQGYFDRGSTRVEMGDLEAGLSDLNEAIQRNSKSAAAYAARARVYLQLDNHTAAERDFTQAIALDSNNPALAYERGCLYYDKEEWGEALTDFERAMQLDPRHDEYARIRTALVQLREGETDTAHATLRELVQRWKATPDDWLAFIAAFLTGDVSREDFLARMQSTYSRGDMTRECQGYFYAGSLRLAEHDAKGARGDFERAVATRQTTLFEYRSAVRALRVLDSSGHA